MGFVLQIPEPEYLVDVRRRRYVVVGSVQSLFPPDIFFSESLHRQHLAKLSSVEDDALDEGLQVIWEIEPGAITIEKTSIEVFEVPGLSGSWAKCTSSLEHPRTKQKRPIVFDHTLVNGRDDVVLAHLKHRLATMSLRLSDVQQGLLF